MIKLNNKNITYVALADSNNSLKAPKEIWYADSSNSVKLVYRRKDALIEGEDYEKYHWLEGDETAYIELDNQFNTDGNAFIDAHLKQYAQRSNGYDIIIGNNQSVDGYCIRITFASSDFYDLHKVVNGIANSYRLTKRRDDMEHSVHLSFSSIELDGVESTIVWGNQFDSKMHNKFTRIYTGYAQYGEITMRSNNKEFHLIPCRLLRPIPKWLDANGIRRQVGECGMIDLVSGKFYGNVNSVGTFTVENYYERKEWLQGRNGAYIDTNYYPIVGTDVFSVHFHYDGTMKNPDGIEQDAFGVNYKDSNENNFIRAFINSNNYLSCSYYKYIGVWPTTYSHSEDWNIDDLLINGSKFQYSANEVSYSFDNNNIQLQVCPYSLFVFKNNDQVFNQNCYLHGDISSFKITDTSSNTKMNLIPCTLTMDLPASMDANNIARTKGTSGMWDLVSDRFYGNVANSGTFKAVNLAEGVDYEVHDILKTLAENTSSAPYDVAYFRFPNYIPLSGKVLTLKLGNVYRDYNLAGNVVDNARYYILIYRVGSITTIQEKLGNTVLNSVSNSSSTVEIDLDNNVVSVGTSTMNIQGTGYYTFGENNVSWSTAKYLKGLTISDVLNLIPIKLLRSIPLKYDANGIARQAGECGMYDTLNDVFYGNVASSGSFTVSDDN